MAYTAENAPVIKDKMGNMISFREIKVCLSCGKSCDIAVHPCPYCQSDNHARTMLFISTIRSPHGRPIVKVGNFGNHE